jgi:hypothetical protein
MPPFRLLHVVIISTCCYTRGDIQCDAGVLRAPRGQVFIYGSGTTGRRVWAFKTGQSAPPQPTTAARNPGGLELEARNGYLFVPGGNGTRVTMLDARTDAILISRCHRGSV